MNRSGIKRLYEWRLREPSRLTTIEERVVVVAAKNWDSAFRKMEQEGRSYCTPDSQSRFLITALGTTCQGYLMDPEEFDPSRVIEVYRRLYHHVEVGLKRDFIRFHLAAWPHSRSALVGHKRGRNRA
jgi:hypothetical protein